MSGTCIIEDDDRSPRLKNNNKKCCQFRAWWTIGGGGKFIPGRHGNGESPKQKVPHSFSGEHEIQPCFSNEQRHGKFSPADII